MSFLDLAPLDWRDPRTREVRAVLANAYPDAPAARMICQDAGLGAPGLPSGNMTMLAWWHSVMNTLAGAALLRPLVEFAAGDPAAVQWQRRLRELLSDDPAVAAPGASSVPGPDWWKGAAEPPRLSVQRQLLARARYTSVRVARQVTDVAGSVARLELRFGNQPFHGTGFLIADRLLLTNHHNVEHDQLGPVTSVVADFDHEEQPPEEPVVRRGLVPDIVKCSAYDWAVIPLESPVARAPLALGSPFPTSEDDTLIIIQHPLGGVKQFTIDYLSVRHADDDVVQYLADTQKGSSGAPVFNSRMHVVALHHAEVAVQSGGTGPAPPTYRNEGVQIERVMAGLDCKGVPYCRRHGSTPA